MLTTALLTDEGKQNLQKKMDEINFIVAMNPTTVMEMNADVANVNELTKDERLLSNVLKSMKLHQKAKVVIFDQLDIIEKQKLSEGHADPNVRDIVETYVDFEQVQD